MKNTIENNELIAEFMGLSEPYYLPQYGNIRPNGEWKDEFNINQLKYNSSWDWLMPVVEKIETLGFWIRMDYGDVFVVDDDSNIIIENPMHEDGYTKLSLVYQVVVEFITWYNKNK